MDDQRPDLDAAIDRVVPSLTAVDDATAADSLRRTRIALAERSASAGLPGWRWAVPAAAAIAAAIVAAVVFWARTDVTEAPRVAVKTTAPAPAVLPTARPPVAPFAAAPTRVQPTRLVRAPRVAAASAPRPDETPQPDPLVALVRAVQLIPEDAWSRSVARANSPVIVQDVTVTSIDVTPLASPAAVAIEPLAPGEP